jgi:rod shape-determining protein MreC
MFRELLLRYRQTLVLGLALALPIASMYFHGKDRKETSVFERGLLTVTAPAQQATHDAIEGARGLLHGYVLLTEVESRNQALERENRILLGEALKSRSQAEELRRVKQLCDFRADRKELATVPARVVGRDVSQFFQVMRLQLDVEGQPGIKEGAAVITHDGVVGRIEKVSGSYADVMLVTDSRSQVHSTIPGKGVIGSVKGKGKKNEFAVQFVYLDRIDRTVPIAVGDAVLTTGHDHVFPAGLEIGHVAEAVGTQNGQYHEFLLAPAVTYATLEEVLIVTGYRAAEPGEPPLPPPVDPANAPAMHGEGPPVPAPVPAKGKHAIDPANTPDAPP